MRVRNSIINIITGIGNQLIITLLSFVSRTVFINSLGIEYLGVNSLFTNILMMLTLSEAGIGASIMYSLYKPVAENDTERIKRLMRLYRNAYMVIALVVMLLGLSVLPFLNDIVRDQSVQHLHVIYLIFLVNTVAPYFFSYKNAFLSVNQKNYIVTAAFSINSILSALIKISILYFTSNYILFLIVDSIMTISTAAILNMIANRKYPYLKEKAAGKLDPETKSDIVKNVKAIVIQNIGSFLILETESILISIFVSVSAVGLYSNYKMLIDISRTFINQVFQNLYHSVGNLVSSESKEKVYSVYKVMQLLSFWLYSLLAIVLFVTIEPFIKVWIGQKFLLPSYVLMLLLLLFFERGMRNPITTIKTTAGIFHEDRFVPLAQAGIGLTVSIILVQQIGIAGVFTGSLMGTLAMPFWTTPYLVYTKVFRLPVSHYYRAYLGYTATGFAALGVAWYAGEWITPGGFAGVVLKALLSFIVVNLVYVLIFRRREEFTYLASVAKGILGRVSTKMSPVKKREVH
ncbi:lipopolysaccharide biosynthesis protein [Paenibacillus sp. sgz500958]|uniref:lipopolysaccharide biosynthesis protein n=1 Tax=Paenibacillus sp. sgz500958 TaxID=3242475 RepID=UPI0036D31032